MERGTEIARDRVVHGGWVDTVPEGDLVMEGVRDLDVVTLGVTDVDGVSLGFTQGGWNGSSGAVGHTSAGDVH